MKNSWMKRALAVLLCLAVFAVSELSGVTNVVRDLGAQEMDDEAGTSEDTSDDVEEIALEPSEDDDQSETEAPTEAEEEAPASEAPAGEEAGTDEGGEAADPASETGEANPDSAETSESGNPDGENKEDGTSAEAGNETEAGTEGTETPTGTEDLASGQETLSEGQLAEVKDGEAGEKTAAAKSEEKPEPVLKLVNDQDDNITVTMEAEEAGIIPAGTSLSVTPIEKKEVTDDMEDAEKAKAKEINAQYDLTAEKLKEASEEREDDIVGFLAYDICLKDEDGNKTSPDGEVKVKLSYKEAAIPEELKDAETKDADVTVMHLEEDADGEVKKAVDLADKVEDIKTTGGQEVEETEFVTDSSDIYAIAWTGEAGVYTYENDEVVISVTEETEGAIPAGSRLHVVPILPQNSSRYQEVAEKLKEKAENETYEIAGFLAYDISLIDKAGNKMEPGGGVKVTMDYKKAVIPAEVDASAHTLANGAEASKEEATAAPELDLTVMHLEENNAGDVTQVVDMGAAGDVKQIETTENQEIQKTEFVTDSFSVFTITWTWDGKDPYVYEDDQVIITITPVDENSIPEGTTLSITPIEKDNAETAEEYQKVDQKLQEASEKEEGGIAGFLAYDITLIGKDGNEIEPEGKVKVTMDYKQPTVPDAVAEMQAAIEEAKDASAEEEQQEEAEGSVEGEEDTVAATIIPTSDGFTLQFGEPTDLDVTVMHLEEDENGEVAKVVDMSKQAETALETTENQEIQKVEFVTECFSVFTIKWDSNNWNKSYRINAKYYDADKVLQDITPKTDSNKVYDYRIQNGTIDKISNQNLLTNGGRSYMPGAMYGITDTDGKGYKFKEAIILDSNNSKVAAVSSITMTLNSNSISTVPTIGNNQTLCFVYEEDTLGVLRQGIDTVDTKSLGIKLRMTDHNPADGVGPTRGNSQAGASGMMDGTNIHGKESKYGIGYPGDSTVASGLVKNLLENDYPARKDDNSSLKSLFSGDSGTDDLNYLFQSINGYYEYDSSKNYAVLDGNTFKVYDAVGTPLDRINGNAAYQRGNFFPYDDIKAGYYSDNATEDGTKKLYLTEVGQRAYGRPNYFFGMNMELSFVQPKGGEVTYNGVSNPMVYEFNGDDDLWIFIDDVLVLDMGGIHFNCAGSIDFQNGTITITDGEGENRKTTETSIKAMFDKAAENASAEIKKKIGEMKWDDNTFADYSSHTLKMFYMERGGGASTLHMKMNIPPIPKGTLEVEKQLEIEDDEKLNYKDLEFAFKVELQKADKTYEVLNPEWINAQNAGVTEDAKKIKTLVINTNTNVSREITLDADGTFKLKPGEKLQVTNMNETLTYRVTELNVNSNEYDVVTINGVTAQNPENPGDSSNLGNNWVTTPAQIHKVPHVTFLNDCSTANERELRITKEIEDMVNADKDAEFTFEVNLGGKPYTGSYELLNANGVTESTGTAVNGRITGVKAGQTAVIKSVLSGTEYSVREVLDADNETYKFKSIEASEKLIEGGSDISGSGPSVSQDGTTVIGNMNLWKDVEVTVTNQHKTRYTWELVKRSSSSNEQSLLTLAGAEFTLSLLGEDGNVITEEGAAVYTGASNAQGVVEWKDSDAKPVASIPAGTYQLKETKAPAGYQLSGIDWTVKIVANGQVKITQDNSEVKPDKTDNPEEDGSAIIKTTYYFNNDPAYELPSTGGNGTHWYTIGGTLLMLAGMLILYRNKKRYAGRC